MLEIHRIWLKAEQSGLDPQIATSEEQDPLRYNSRDICYCIQTLSVFTEWGELLVTGP